MIFFSVFKFEQRQKENRRAFYAAAIK